MTVKKCFYGRHRADPVHIRLGINPNSMIDRNDTKCFEYFRWNEKDNFCLENEQKRYIQHLPGGTWIWNPPDPWKNQYNDNGSIRTFHQQDTETLGNNSMHGTTTSTLSSQTRNLPFAQLLEKSSPQELEQFRQILYKLQAKNNEQSTQASVSTENTANTSRVTFHTEEPTDEPTSKQPKTHEVTPSKPSAEPMDIDQE